MKFKYTGIVILIVLMTFLLAGCGSSGGGDDGGGGDSGDSTADESGGGATASMTLSADPTSIPADGSGSTSITATLTDDAGNAVTQGTSVTFSTTLGTLSSGTTTTPDDTGVVIVSLIAGTTAGPVTVTATSNNVTQTTSVTFTESGGGASTIIVSAHPTSIVADGTSTSTITATVKSAANQAVPDVDVIFETERGTIISPVTTDSSGQAVAELTSDRWNDSEVKITAKVKLVQESITVAFTGIDLSLEADPDNLLAGGDPSTITATLKDAAGNPIPDAIIEFSIEEGGGVLDGSSQETDMFGKAGVGLDSSKSSTVKVTANGRGKDADQPVQVVFTRYLFTLKAYKQGTDPADDINTIRVNEQADVIAKIIEAGGNNMAFNNVFFSTSLGDLEPMSAETDIFGLAETTLTADIQAGVAIIDANVTIGSDTPPTELSASTQIVVVGGDATKIVLGSSPNVISTDTGVSTITARVYDDKDQPAVNQDIWFRITDGPGSGEYLSNAVKTTDNFGIATTKLHAGSLPSTLEGVEIEANTKSDFEGSSGVTSLTIAGPIANIGVGIDLHNLTPDGGHLTVDVSALATDANGNPVPDGTSVNFSVDAIEFDEDRDNDGDLECWDFNGDPIDPCPDYSNPGLGVTWFTDDVNLDGEIVVAMATTEDVDNNGILDTGEDINGNGVIDPVNSCIVDSNIETVNGVASSTLYYLQSHAENIKIRLTAEAGGVSNFYEAVLLCTDKMVDNGTCGLGY